MFIDTTFPPPDGRLAQFARLLADFERDEIEAAVDGLLSMLDAIDGDPDLEPVGDELDGNDAEDDFMPHTAQWNGGPGCPISDPGGNDANDEAADPAWIEWQTRGRHKFDQHSAERLARDATGIALQEDDEDDDSAEQDDPPEDDDTDHCAAGDDGCGPFLITGVGRFVWGSEHEATLPHAAGPEALGWAA